MSWFLNSFKVILDTIVVNENQFSWEIDIVLVLAAAAAAAAKTSDHQKLCILQGTTVLQQLVDTTSQ